MHRGSLRPGYRNLYGDLCERKPAGYVLAWREDVDGDRHRRRGPVEECDGLLQRGAVHGDANPVPEPNANGGADGDPNPVANPDADGGTHGDPNPVANPNANGGADGDPNPVANRDADANPYPEPNVDAGDADARAHGISNPWTDGYRDAGTIHHAVADGDPDPVADAGAVTHANGELPAELRLDPARVDREGWHFTR